MAKQNESAGQEPKRRGKRGPRSDKPERILAFLRNYFAEFNYPPSVRDIVEGCNLSSTSVADYNLKILEKEGHITRDRERARTISLTQPLEPTQVSVEAPELMVPLMGTTGAGSAILEGDGVDADHAEDHIAVTKDMIAGRDPESVFAVTVKGDSMKDEMITDNDTLILEYTPQVLSGQIAVVWLSEASDFTVKRVRYDVEDDFVQLHPANSEVEPFPVKKDDMRVLGRVVSVIRHLR